MHTRTPIRTHNRTRTRTYPSPSLQLIAKECLPARAVLDSLAFMGPERISKSLVRVLLLADTAVRKMAPFFFCTVQVNFDSLFSLFFAESRCFVRPAGTQTRSFRKPYQDDRLS